MGDQVIQEERIELLLNGTLLLAMLALPRDIEALALGFLVTEGLSWDRRQLPDISFDPSKGRVRCEGRFDPDGIESIQRRWTVGTGCGGGGTARDGSLPAGFLRGNRMDVYTRYDPVRDEG
ncbi:MAG: formate dehydrogenase accessory sulfurtransferase FdhD [Planctomycetota bacterium]